MKVYLLLCSLLLCTALSAQNFFKPLPKIEETGLHKVMRPHVNKIAAPVVTFKTDSTMNAVRPIASIAGYEEPGHILMAGAGIAYEHLKYDFETGHWKAVWSIAAVGWAGGSVAPKTPTDAVSYGVMFGFLNNLVMVGPALNAGKLRAVVSVGININNN